MSHSLVLITGRTAEQGHTLHLGEHANEYLRATSQVEMNPQDLLRLGLVQGQQVLLQTLSGQVEATVSAGSVPEGIVFLPLGPTASQLVAPETEGTGMPLLKGLAVTVRPALDGIIHLGECESAGR